MITKWKVFNFKSIREEEELSLERLTIFAGANSSGKSTILQSILLIAQTLSSKLSSRSVVLNGALTSLGQFDDLKSNGSESDQITIKCICRPSYDHGTTIRQRPATARQRAFYYNPRSTLQEIGCEISFDADPSSPQRDVFQMQPRLFSSQLVCTSRDEENTDQKAEISIRHSRKSLSEVKGTKSISGIDDQLRAGLAYSVELDETSMAEVKEEFHSARPKECILRHFLPELIIYEIDMIEENAKAITRALQDDIWRGVGFRRHFGRGIPFSEEIVSVLRDVLQDTINFDKVFYQPQSLFGSQPMIMTTRFWNERIRKLSPDTKMKIRDALRQSDDLFERILKAIQESSPSSSQPRDLISRRPPRQIAEATRYLDNFFTYSLKYLGPLRDAPKPLYPLAPAADPNDVGLRGEHTAAILDLHKNKRIRYIPSTNFRTPAVDRTTVMKTLETAVIDWLQYLGVASSVKSQDQGKLGHELKVGLDSPYTLHDLTHVGVGVSQVLPILVMCLLADSDSTLVFEQPGVASSSESSDVAFRFLYLDGIVQQAVHC